MTRGRRKKLERDNNYSSQEDSEGIRFLKWEVKFCFKGMNWVPKPNMLWPWFKEPRNARWYGFQESKWDREKVLIKIFFADF